MDCSGGVEPEDLLILSDQWLLELLEFDVVLGDRNRVVNWM